MLIFKSEPTEPALLLKQREEILADIEASFNKLEGKQSFSYTFDKVGIRGEVTFLYVPGFVKEEAFLGGDTKYSEYLVMFSCGGNNYKLDINIYNPLQPPGHKNPNEGKMILTLEKVSFHE